MITSFGFLGSLPDRQLRKYTDLNTGTVFRSLPDRQLRKWEVKMATWEMSSLPDRQLRKNDLI